MLFWDTETHDCDPVTSDIIQIAGVIVEFDRVKGFIKHDDFETKIWTEKDIAPGAKEVHSLSKSDLIGSPDFSSAMSEWKAWMDEVGERLKCNRYMWFAHNGTRFDNIVMYCNHITHNLSFEDTISTTSGFVDTLKLAQKVCRNHGVEPKNDNQKVSYALGCLHSSFANTVFTKAHDALNDVHAMIDFMQGLFERGMLTFSDIHSLARSVEQEKKLIFSIAGTQYIRTSQEIKSANVQKLTNTPVFQPLTQMDKKLVELNLRLCLNCQNFVNKTEHDQCQMILV
jgi:DNA polymerase III epsilon subunit-like protein